MRTILAMLTERLGWIRILLSILGVATIHYWAFVTALPGNITLWVDGSFLAQFYTLFIAHIAVTSLMLAFACLLWFLVLIVLAGLPNHELIDKFVGPQPPVFLSGLFWLILFDYSYSRLGILEASFPYLFSPAEYWKRLLLDAALISLGTWGMLKDFKREEKRKVQILTLTTGTGAPNPDAIRQVALLSVMSLMFLSGVAGIARGKSVGLISQSLFHTTTGEFSYSIVGQTHLGYVGIDLSNDTSVLIPYSQILSLMTESSEILSPSDSPTPPSPVAASPVPVGPDG